MVEAFCNQRGTAERHGKEGETASRWPRRWLRAPREKAVKAEPGAEADRTAHAYERVGMKLLVICGLVAFPSAAFGQGPDDFTIATWRYFCAATLEYPNAEACVADLSGEAAFTPSRQTQSYDLAEPSAPRADQATESIVDAAPA